MYKFSSRDHPHVVSTKAVFVHECVTSNDGEWMNILMAA